MCGSVAPSNRTFTHDNSEVDNNCLNLF